MDLATLSETDKAELNARLLAIDIVSWRWNAHGLALNAADGRPKSGDKVEKGVIAQTVRDQLGEYFPNITPHHKTGVLMVDYGLLADIARAVLRHLDDRYQMSVTDVPPGERLNLDDLLRKYYTDEPQLSVVRLLALVKLYNQKMPDSLLQ
jgi:hypothetical protein